MKSLTQELLMYVLNVQVFEDFPDFCHFIVFAVVTEHSFYDL